MTSATDISSLVRLVLICFTLKREWQRNGATAEIHVILMLYTGALTRLNTSAQETGRRKTTYAVRLVFAWV